jgi:transcriptional regulator with XRE-family HTH domain
LLSSLVLSQRGQGGRMRPEQLLGKRIRELRKARKLTIDHLAEITEINEKYLGSVERGEQNPSFKVLRKLAKALSIDLPDLFVLDHIESDPKILQKRINSLLAKSNAEQLQLFFKILKSIKE